MSNITGDEDAGFWKKFASTAINTNHSSCRTFEQIVSQKESCESYFERFEQFVDANGVAEIHQVAYFLSALAWYRNLWRSTKSCPYSKSKR